jgi:alpha-beta hydrolase superfamily lysophospholipase
VPRPLTDRADVRRAPSAPSQFFANELPQIGFEVAAFDHPAQGIVDDRLLAALTDS